MPKTIWSEFALCNCTQNRKIFAVFCLFTFTVNVHTHLALEAEKGLVLANVIGIIFKKVSIRHR